MALSLVPRLAALSLRTARGRAQVEILESRYAPAAVAVFDITTLNQSTGGTIAASGTEALGLVTTSAGDVNGDGFDDLLITAPLFSAGEDNQVGAAFVLLGSAEGIPAAVDYHQLNGTNGFRVQGSISGIKLGLSAAAAGDLNSDGYGDLVLGTDPESNGGVYVVFGRANFASTNGLVVTDALNGTAGFNLQARAPGSTFGAVSGIGDFNGDGLDDLLVASRTEDTNDVHVIFGQRQFPTVGGTFALSSLNGLNGFTLTEEKDDDESDPQFGAALSGAGDVNGDGFADFVVGRPYGGGDFRDDEGGSALVVLGGPDFSATEGHTYVDSDFGVRRFSIRGSLDYGHLGVSVSAVGDVNGDGYADLAFGTFQDNAEEAGLLYVWFGHADPQSVSIGSLNATEVLEIQMPGSNLAYFTVGHGGDLNADGYSDIVIGAPFYSSDVPFTGAAFVIYGGPQYGDTEGYVDVTMLDGENGMIIPGVNPGSQLGVSVHSGFDLNGDGLDDLLLGAPMVGGPYYGSAVWIHGFDTGAITHVSPGDGDSIDGTTGPDVMVGSAQTDGLNGLGVADVFHAGAGNDFITVTDLDFQHVDGGHGTDMLTLNGSGHLLDLTGALGRRVHGIEMVNLRGAGANELILDKQAVLKLSDTSNTLRVLNDADDVITLGTGWTPGGTETVENVTYTVFTQGEARLLVENAPAYLSVADVSQPESTGSTTQPLTFTITRGGSLTDAVTVNYTIEGLTATEGVDYLGGGSGTLTIPAGQSSATITLQVVGDNVVEGNETLRLNLTSVTGAQLLRSEALATILNDDTTLVISPDRKTATYRDVDGDLVTVKTSKPVLDAADFTFVAGGTVGGQQLQTLFLNDEAAAGTSVSITAKRGSLGGDGFVNVGTINARGVNLGTVLVAGDLGQIDAGNDSAIVKALGSLTVQSLGRLGDANFSPEEQAREDAFTSNLRGSVGKIVVKTDVHGASLRVDGEHAGVASIALGGSLASGGRDYGGNLTVLGHLGSLTIGRDVVSNSDHGSNVVAQTLGSVKVGGSLVGGGFQSANIDGGQGLESVTIGGDLAGFTALSASIAAFGIGSVKIGGSLVQQDTGAASIFSTYDLGSVSVGGSVFSATQTVGTSIISAAGQIGTITIGGSFSAAEGVRISAAKNVKSVSLGGSATNLQVVAGDDLLDAAIGGGASFDPATANIGKITVKGDWTNSIVAAGVQAGEDEVFGTEDDLGGAVGSKIGAITIGGQVRGGLESALPGVFTAREIGALKVGTTAFKLSAAVRNEFVVGGDAGTQLREVWVEDPQAPVEPALLEENGLVIAANGKSATFTDVDGDLVTVTTDKGLLKEENFVLGDGARGGFTFQRLDLAGDPDFVGKAASITIAAAPSTLGGDGWVDVGWINAAGVDLAKVTVDGDLGLIDAGDEVLSTLAIGSLTVHSLAMGNSYVQEGEGTVYRSEINGGVGTFTVVTDVGLASVQIIGDDGNNPALGGIKTLKIGGSIYGYENGTESPAFATEGAIGSFTVGGDILGSTVGRGAVFAGGGLGTVKVGGSLMARFAFGDNAGSIRSGATMGVVTIGGSLFGGFGEKTGSVVSAGNVKSVAVKGSLYGEDRLSGSILTTGTTADDGTLGSVTVGGSLHALSVVSTGILSASTLGTVKIGGDVRGHYGNFAVVLAEGLETPSTAAQAVALKSLSIGGSVVRGSVLVGYNTQFNAVNADVQVGSVAVKGDWAATRINVGVGFEGGLVENGGQPGIVARIASITVGGAFSAIAGDPSVLRGITAEEIGSFKAGAVKYPLTAGRDELQVGPMPGAVVREVGVVD